ncbi:MAPEG family protein [Caulobacter sp. 17J65-9]|uniref:MAPEG family protein n=1 Tax=Caulobacter sp. 17J65-9 TaxID=2709382 RepID=UPI0013CBAF35|nr:MAPEG family protein [Caulobacter sp. 17J65-9]NEX92681.1 hypothetical protein [Caulobacter sp. 17J65-9]
MDLSLIWPATALVGLTCVVWFVLYARRIPYMQRNRIAPDRVASRAQVVELLGPVQAPANNFNNLLELPVLFYFLAVVATMTGRTGEAMTVAAWAFVALRVLHSLIQCTYNKVMHRFLVYSAGALVLWGMWAGWAISMFR